VKINFDKKTTIFFLCLFLVVGLIFYFSSKRLVLLKGLFRRPPAYETVIKTPQFEVRKIQNSLIPFQNDIPYGVFEKKQAHAYRDLGGLWKSERVEVDQRLTLKERTPGVVKKIEQESEGRFKVGYNDKTWQDKKIPGMENSPPDPYQGCVWYRREFDLGQEDKGKVVKLSFEGANYVTDVWINGRWAGAHEGGYLPFSFEVTDYLNYGNSNTIAVRVDNIPWIPHRIIVPEDKEVNDKDIIPYKTSDWWNAGGITRDVYLEIMPPINIVRADVKTKIQDNNRVQLLIDAVVFNDSRRTERVDLELKIFKAKIDESNILSLDAKEITDFNQKVAGPVNEEGIILLPKEAKSIQFTLEVDKDKALFWHPDTPHLYILGVSLSSQKEKIGSFYTQFGIREIKVDNENCKLLLNGQPIFLRGVARHEVFPYTQERYKGIEGIYEDLLMIKKLNSNFLRTGHYPNHPATYLLSDRVGLLVWEEIPVFWFDGPQFDLQRTEKKIAKQMWLEMIYRDYNRPSIIIWSSCNESTAADKEQRLLYLEDMYETAGLIDGTRLVVQSAVGDDLQDYTHEVNDLVGITSYHGIFYSDDYYADTSAALDTYHAFHPDKPILLTEFGIWSEKDMSNAQKQVMVAQDTYEAARKKDFVAGVTWWCMFDWHTMISEPQSMGLVTWDRQRYKTAYYMVQRLYGKELGGLAVSLDAPPPGTRLQGEVDFTYSVKNAEELESIVIFLGEKEYKRFPVDTIKQTITVDTTNLEEGLHDLRVVAKQRDGLSVSSYSTLLVDNIDLPPEVALLNVENGDSVFYKKPIVVRATDDRVLEKVSFRVGDSRYRPMEHMGFDYYLATFDASVYPDGSVQSIEVKAEDVGGNETVRKLNFQIDKKPGIAVSLPFDHDWISYQENPRDADDFYNFPAEFLPESNSWFIHNGKERVKFKFPDKEAGKDNNVECRGQLVRVPAGQYRKVHFLATMHDGSGVHQIALNYRGRPSVMKPLVLSDWWVGNAHYGEEVAFLLPYHHQFGAKKKPTVGIYVQTLESDPNKILESITFPINPRVHIFAITLE
jgi:hypothetical protein